MEKRMGFVLNLNWIDHLKEIFRYALNTFSDAQFNHALNGILPPFRTPQHLRRFYEQLWDALFENEAWKIECLDEYIVSDEWPPVDSFYRDDDGWVIRNEN
jgi:hypothetical protein